MAQSEVLVGALVQGVSAMISLVIIAAGIVGVFVGVWSHMFFSKKIIPGAFQRCRLCINAHDAQDHEQWKGWDQ